MYFIEKFIDDAKIDSKEFFEYISKVDNEELTEFVSVLNEIINKSYNPSLKKGNFNFIANSTLSGLSFPCGELDCKIAQVMNLAKNAILYSDTVFIQNPFEKYLKYKSYNDKSRYELISDLIILGQIKPLLREKVFQIAKSEVHYCHDCYTRFQDNYLKTFDWNLNVIEPLIEDYILNNLDYYLINSNGKICVEISGENDLLEHPIIISFVEYIPKPLDKIVVSSEKVKLNISQIKESGMLYFLLDETISNLSYQDFYSKYYSAHVLTNRNFDISLLKIFNKDFSQNDAKKNRILQNLNHIVPFVGEVSLEKLLKIRKNEGEAFQVYRDKLNKVVKTNSLTIQDAKQIFMDEINPELNKINLTLKNNKKVLWGNIKSNIFLASTYISASLFTGILPSNIDKIVASIGGFGFAKSIGQDVIKMIKRPEVRQNELYFLWKIKNENKIKI